MFAAICCNGNRNRYVAEQRTSGTGFTIPAFRRHVTTSTGLNANSMHIQAIIMENLVEILNGITSFLPLISFLPPLFAFHTFISLPPFSGEVTSLSFEWHSFEHRAATCASMSTLVQHDDVTYIYSHAIYVQSHKPLPVTYINILIVGSPHNFA
jgi:hypothetical protein